MVLVAKEMGIKSMLAKIGRAVVVASVLLGAALVCVVGVFVAAGIVVLPPIAKDLHIMHNCVSSGAMIVTVHNLLAMASLQTLFACGDV